MSRSSLGAPTGRRAARALAPVVLLALALASPAAAISLGTLGPNGSVPLGSTGSVSIGSGGDVYELDAFVHVAGQDLNGAAPGEAARLSQDPLPAGVDLLFSSALSDSDSDWTLTYQLVNDTGGLLSGVTVLSYLDAEIDEPLNGFFNEFVTPSGSLAAGQSFEADEPGFVFGDILDNVLAGALDGANAVDAANPEDAAMALAFALPDLAEGDVAVLRVMLSEDGDHLGDFALAQADSDPRSSDVITFSGSVEIRREQPGEPIPEPRAALLFGVGGLLVATRLRHLPSRP
jgi:hypothetical protein